jgi:hypothetical protein
MSIPIKILSDEDRARLRVIAEKLKGKELFPQSVTRVIPPIKSALIPEAAPTTTEKDFTQDTQLFHEEVKIISQKIAEFLAEERKMFDSKIKNAKGDTRPDERK